MKKILFAGLSAAAICLFSGCSQESVVTGNGSGTIRPDVAVSNEVLTRSQATTRGAIDEIQAADLSLTLTKADGSETYTYQTLSEFPTDRQFDAGDYTLKATYGTEGAEGFELPYLHGETTLTVFDKKETPVSLTAGLGNAIVNIVYNDAFKNYFDGYSATVTTLKAAHFVAADETRDLYVNPGAVTPSVTYTTPTGETKTINGSAFTAEAKTKYNVTFSLNNTSGKVLLTISYDSSTEIEDIVIDLSDDIESTPAPTLEGIGFTPGTPVVYVEGSYNTAEALDINVIARAGIASAILETNSAALRQKGLPATIELVNADAGTQAMLNSLGFNIRGFFRNPDQMAVVSFAGVLNNIPCLDGGGSNENTFTLTVTDRVGRVTEPLALIVEPTKSIMSISELTPLYIYDGTASVALSFNGVNPQESVTFETKNKRGTWDKVNATVTEADATTAATVDTKTYKVSIPVPENEDNVTIRASFANIKSEITLVRKSSDVVVTVAPENVFATRATINIAAADGTPVTGAALRLSSGNAPFVTQSGTSSNGVLALTGLTPGTEYTGYVLTDGIPSKTFSFTTEEATPVPNGNMDGNTNIDGSASNWENIVFPDGWGTNNAMTTSQGSNYAYVRISGTKQVDDAHSGKAVRLRTNGWGSGNSSTGNWGGFMKSACKYIDPGLLHLGATRTARPSGYDGIAGSLNTDDLDCGIPFASRPESLSFWYKYSPVNSADHGEALVQVFDAAGNIIAQNKTDLGTQSEYVQKILTLEYAPGAAKAAKIYIRFLSTNVAESMQKNNSWFLPSPFGNLNRGEHHGSDLYIDDLTFNY